MKTVVATVTQVIGRGRLGDGIRVGGVPQRTRVSFASNSCQLKLEPGADANDEDSGSCDEDGEGSEGELNRPRHQAPCYRRYEA